ncbi:PREDICTED: arylsulfatase F [Myotis brandtii]|uniref:arylsulfatase F n=1 Tax=Myotis brandtii TaxID=109478 RepID=UPI00070471D5|nr:PREDICTED: arylsulfatase F [Myotis brandtii]
MTLRRRWASLSWMWLLLTVGQSQRADDDKPNIVLIMADDLGIGDLGCYGNDTIRTPNIDSLAREGVQLTQNIAAASLCTPSRSAFLTGRYPIRSGMVSDGNDRVILSLGAPVGLPRNETTFAHLVKEQGYSTAIIGKWHQGLNCNFRNDYCRHPSHYGFDYFYGMPYSLYDTCWPDPSRDAELAISGRLWICVQLVAMAALTLALGKLRRVLCVPWALILSLVLFILLLGHFWLDSYQSTLYWNCLLMREQEITEQPMKAERAGSIMVKEAISFLERSFFIVSGKLLAAIDDLGLRNHTLVYFTSDHGGHLEARLGHAQLGGYNGIFKGGKGTAGWEGGIRVPGLFRWPGKLPAGNVIDEPTSLMDILPTVAALTGGIVPQDRVIDGRNLMPLLQGQVQRSEHEFLFHYCSRFLHAARWRPKDSDAMWKVHYVTPIFQPPGAQACYETTYCQCIGDNVTYHDPPLLFDLSQDPSESTPLTKDTEPLYDLVIHTVADAVKEHRKTITQVQPQLGPDRNRQFVWLMSCCGVFPFCFCDKEGEGSTRQAAI